MRHGWGWWWQLTLIYFFCFSRSVVDLTCTWAFVVYSKEKKKRNERTYCAILFGQQTKRYISICCPPVPFVQMYGLAQLCMYLLKSNNSHSKQI
jgi:hypothetical protein